MTAHTNEDIYNELHKFMDTIDRWRVRVDTKQEKHDKTLYGNGEPGMDEIMRRHQADLDMLRKLSLELQPMIVFYKVGVWVAAIIGASLIALIWSLITGQAEIFIK